MAELRPFRGLRYRPDVAGDVGALLSPPFDTIDADEQVALHERSPYNIVRIELGLQKDNDTPEDNRYTRSRSALSEWRGSGVLIQEKRPAFYLYHQEFEHQGGRLHRAALFARVRLEPWDAGVVRPHEKTMAAPKKDRLELMRHLHANISPVFVLYRDADGRVSKALNEASAALFDAATPDGQRHALAKIDDDSAIEAIAAALKDQPLYIADGHHRYETALAFRDERKQQAEEWTGEEPENFVMLAMTAIEDPGLTLLPFHQLLRPAEIPPDLLGRLERYFSIESIEYDAADSGAAKRLTDLLAGAGGSTTAIGTLGLEQGRCHLLTLKDAAAARALMPSQSEAWQELDVNVMEYAVIRDALGTPEGASVDSDYTQDAARVLRDITSGAWPIAFLLNGPNVGEILSVADAGERMPRKSTFFDPKLATGLVLNPFE